ncbi:MAG: hypothetical protein ACI9SE_001974, partial [Neolewinella sp.]
KAPPLTDGVWLLPASGDDGVREAPDDWVPKDSRYRLVVFLQPH